MKKYFLFVIIVFICGISFSQKAETSVIQTSAQCNDCKERIEGKLNYTKGIKYAELDMETKKVTVKYSPKKISLQKVKELIASIGYDADEVKAKQEDVLKLPKCCQPGGMEFHKD
jgi:mercuric ion binding protein